MHPECRGIRAGLAACSGDFDARVGRRSEIVRLLGVSLFQSVRIPPVTASPTHIAELVSSWITEVSGSQKPFNFQSELFRRAEAEGALGCIARNGFRAFYGRFGGKGSGTADVVRFGSGAEINVVNCVFPALSSSVYEAEEPLITIRASLSCNVVYRVAGAKPITFDRPELTLVCLPRGLKMAVDVLPGARHQGVIGHFPPSSFISSFGLSVDDLPPALQEVINGKVGYGRLVSLPINRAIANLVADTIDSPLEGEMLALKYAGRLAELAALTFTAMRETGEGAVRTWRDADLAQLTLKRLSESYQRPPLFRELAHELATNHNRLQTVFKAAYGVTMADYCLERRMREAQRLLLEGKLNVAQIAERVGYNHQSNFTATFSAHTGMSPREYLQHRAPISLPIGKT